MDPSVPCACSPGEKSAMDQPPPYDDNNAGNSLIPGGYPNQSGYPQGQSYGAPYGQPHEGQSPGLYAGQRTNPGEKSAVDLPPPYPDDNAGNSPIPGGCPNQSGYPQGQPHEGQSPGLCGGQPTLQPTVYVTTVTTAQPLPNYLCYSIFNTTCCCLSQGAAALFFPIRLFINRARRR